jgi:hypothetical protein
VIFSGHALAAKGKKAEPKAPAATMAEGGDPVEKEQSEAKTPKVVPPTDAEIAEQERKADAAAAKKSREREKFGLFANLLLGFGKAPVPGPTTEETTGKTTSGTFMVGGYYDLSPEFTLGARLPWTIGTQRQPDGDNASVNALGALELMGEYRVSLSPFTRLPIFFGLGLPTAQGNYNEVGAAQKAQLNIMADAASGYRDPELFGPKRLPLIAGVGIDYQRKALSLHAATKFVLGIKVGGDLGNVQDPTGAGTYELKSVTFRNVTSGGIAYQFLDRPKLFGALDSWLAYNAINAVEFKSTAGATPPTRFQVVLEPRIAARFGKISPSIGYIFPIGGRLADSSTSGLELHCDFGF